MNRKCYRFFGGLISAQERWLDRMAAGGYRLIRTEKLLYEFEPCEKGKYRYRVEFVGQKSRTNAADYARFLEDCGYRVYFKNINLNWNVGKLVLRPWAEPGGRVAANRSTFGRELLIVEKECDGRPFEMHTTFEDKINYCKQLRGPWLYLFLVSVSLGIVLRSWGWAVLAAISATGLLIYQAELSKLRKQAKTKEW